MQTDKGYITYTTSQDGKLIAVTLQDEDHRILEVLWREGVITIDKQTVRDKVMIISAELSGVDVEDDYNGCFKAANKVLNDLYELVKE